LLLEQLLAPLTTSSLNITVHVFADLPTYRMLSGPWVREHRVVLHDPRQADERPDDSVRPDRQIGRGQPVIDPWLAWLAQEMRDTAVDVVHFFVHGYATGDQPAIAMSESPTVHDPRLWARFISPEQLAGCLTQLGAWSVGFSSPPGNFSPLGLRQFADSVARLRPGPVLHHDPNRDLGGPPADLLGQIYRQLFLAAEIELGPSSFMYVHPRMIGVEGEPAYAESLLARTLGPVSRESTQPHWATVTRRFLEQSTAQLFPGQDDPASAEQKAVGEGVREALSFVNDVIRGHGGQPT
jgi:hypothetical protein